MNSGLLLVYRYIKQIPFLFSHTKPYLLCCAMHSDISHLSVGLLPHLSSATQLNALISFISDLKTTQSVKDMPIVQDGPPPGGFPAFRYARRIPSTGPTGITLFAVSGIIMAYGFYKVGQGNHARRIEKEEMMSARKSLVPFLQAEEDRRYAAMYSFRPLVDSWPCNDSNIMRFYYSSDHHHHHHCRWVKAYTSFKDHERAVLKNVRIILKSIDELHELFVIEKVRILFSLFPSLQSSDFNPDENIYKTRWMPPSVPKGLL